MSGKLVSQYETRVCRSIAEVGRSAWDKLDKGNTPFWRYDFLEALEKSNSVGIESGWQAHFLILEEKNEPEKNKSATSIKAVLPLWQKSHSMGEYVFDHIFAEAYQRSLVSPYYPKLLAAIPFTPVRASKFFVEASSAQSLQNLATSTSLDISRQQQLQGQLLESARELCYAENFSSLHLNFLPEAQALLAEQQGFARRHSLQFHWHNRGWNSFDEFLASLSRSRRKMIKKERAMLQAQGFRFRRLSGAQLFEEGLWDRFYQFYCSTYARKWGYPYLTREFFSIIQTPLADSMLLVVGEMGGEICSVALSFFDDEVLCGRHWGASEYVPYLHFETCYYQSIIFALERGIKLIEAGSQGAEHKLPRGFEPTLLPSVHFFSEPNFARAASEWCLQERRALESQLEQCALFAKPPRAPRLPVRML